MMMSKEGWLAVAMLAASCNGAYAFEEITGRLTYLEATYMPAVAQFTLDTGTPTCPAGKYLKWAKADQNNNKAVYATLMLALAAGKRVRFYINDGDTTCNGQFLHLLPD